MYAALLNRSGIPETRSAGFGSLSTNLDEFVTQVAILLAVVHIDFARVQTSTQLAVDPKFVTVGLHPGGLAIGVEGQQIGPQVCGDGVLGVFISRSLRQRLLLREDALHPRQSGQPGVIDGNCCRLERLAQWPQVVARVLPACRRPPTSLP